MYDLPELRGAHDALWQAIARALVAEGLSDVPDVLVRDRAPEQTWADPELLFAQTCGYPLVTTFAARLRVVATPRYAAPGCEGASYASALVVRAEDERADLAAFRGARCAINELGSHSGANILRAMIAPLAGGHPFFARVDVTGSHAASIAAVAEGKADLAAVDVVTHALLARHRPSALAGTRVLMLSPRAPALPYVTRGDADDATVSALRRALDVAMKDEGARDARDALLLGGVEVLGDDAYDEIARMAREAAAHGYPELA